MGIAASNSLTVDIQQVFPDAPAAGRLELHPPPQVAANVRVYERMSALAFLLALVAVIVGTIVDPSDDWGWGWISFLLLGAFFLLGVIGRWRAGTGRHRSHREEWATWGDARGLQPVSPERLEALPLAPMHAGGDREWLGMLGGPIGRGRTPAVVGSLAYTKQSETLQPRFHCFFVYVELPGRVEDVFPHSNVRRFCSSPVEAMERWHGDELRFESIDLDETHEIYVAQSGDQVAWRDLFGPQMIVELTERHDVQWTHVGRHVMFATIGDWQERLLRRFWRSRAPVQRLDSLCAAAAGIADEMVKVADRHRS